MIPAYSESLFISRGFLAIFGHNFNKYLKIRIEDANDTNGLYIEYTWENTGKLPYNSEYWEDTKIDDNLTESRYTINLDDFNNSTFKKDSQYSN